MDRSTATRMRSVAAEALKDVAAGLGATVRVGGGSYDAGTVRFTVTFTEKGSEKALFAQLAPLVGLEPSDYGATVTLRGAKYRIEGINLRAHSYPVVITAASGRQMKAGAEAVRRALGRA